MPFFYAIYIGRCRRRQIRIRGRFIADFFNRAEGRYSRVISPRLLAAYFLHTTISSPLRLSLYMPPLRRIITLMFRRFVAHALRYFLPAACHAFAIFA